VTITISPMTSERAVGLHEVECTFLRLQAEMGELRQRLRALGLEWSLCGKMLHESALAFVLAYSGTEIDDLFQAAAEHPAVRMLHAPDVTIDAEPPPF
jgi:hypothetical protein